MGRLEIVTGHFDQRTGPVRREWLRNNVRSVRPAFGQSVGRRRNSGAGGCWEWDRPEIGIVYYASPSAPSSPLVGLGAAPRNDVNVKVFGNHQPMQSEWHGGFRLEVRPRGPGTRYRGHFTASHRPFHSGPKSSGKSIPMDVREFGNPHLRPRAHYPMPWPSPMACFASCFARPHHAARGLGSQALRQPRLRAVVASSVLDSPSRHGRRGPPSSEGRVGELHAHRDRVRAAASRASPRSRAFPPECAGVRAGEGL